MTCETDKAGVSRRALLREATRAQHDAAEAAVEAQGFFASRERYAVFLARSLAFHAALEGRAEAAGASRLLPDWPLRRKAGLLRADRAALADVDPPPASLAGPTLLPALDSPAAVLGALYVAEGATLGGAVLARRAAVALGLGPGRGASFLDAYGPARGRRWRGFLDALERAELGLDGEDRLVAAARATFAAYVGAVAGGAAPTPVSGGFGGGPPSPGRSGKVSSQAAPPSG